MSLSLKIREQLISSFGAELAEHVQTMTDGLLALEQEQVTGEQRQFTLETVFRAAHSLKGAARALGISAVEQLAHSLENVLDAMQQDMLALTPELYTTCFRALDTIQLVQAVYDSGGTTPPVQVLQTLAELAAFQLTDAAPSGSSAQLGSGTPPMTSPTVVQASRPQVAPFRNSARLQRPRPPVPVEDVPLPATQIPATENVKPSVMPGMPYERSLTHKDEGNGRPHTASEQRDKPVPSPRSQKSEETQILLPESDDLRPTALPASAPDSQVSASGARVEIEGSVSLPGSPSVSNVSRTDAPYANVVEETIRVSVGKLDALMAQLSELMVAKIRAEQRQKQMHQVHTSMLDWQKEWLFIRRVYGHLVRKIRELEGDGAPVLNGALLKELSYLLDYVSASQEQFYQMHTSLNVLAREYTNDTIHTSLVIDALEQEIKHVRMLSLHTITAPFARMVRDLARAAGKEAVFHLIGGDVELDKRVLEQIKDPLIHLLRNAIDHGIELPEAREALGKSRSGTVTLSAEQLGNDVVIRVADDGRGLDIPAIRRVAAHRANVPDAWALSEGELVELIFNARFSTSPIITDVSGRGLGLDIVRRNVAALGGRIDVDWTLDVGATFALTIPLTLTSSRGLLVRVSKQRFAVPFSAIERILRVRADEISMLGGHQAVRYNGRPFPLVRLGDVIGYSAPLGNGDLSGLPASMATDDSYVLIVIMAAAERRIAFMVDELLGEQEMVVKGLGRPLVRVNGIAGATVMGDGDVVLVLNAADLIKLTLQGLRANRSLAIPVRSDRSLAESGDEVEDIDMMGALHPGSSNLFDPSERLILVVDDSVTTRTLEKNVLEAAGYKVQVAINGEEAWSLIATGDVPDLVLSDVVMPRLDGFGLTERIKRDQRTAKVPVILVTSLDSPEDKARGIEVGADAYIVKSRFDQNNLLETIAQLV
ncbi:MAG: hybrid sensor histidine kinase/response regulator [Anaerolineae bacterium]|nr:hybrid sensor histidine kinase/response regulator [Anaerolineae bacterium]